jgi:hypothetical protein
MILFDYIFYRLEKFFQSLFTDSYGQKIGAPNQAIGLLSVIQLIVFDSIINLLVSEHLSLADLPYSQLWFLLIAVLFFFINYIRYNNIVSFNELKIKWAKEKLIIRILMDTISILFVILCLYF